ncbi:hypothetical protein P171DRAFT_355481 [Karstenula rhodostoma CBS 690.94]|uniref:Biogenesis of lysosome-related organelles complex 1 subunit CNL1 n=1 Tax=Karstenula rhodostoma CBS 690.94 TaxID=1392251 RepID=A0A9P4UCM1_9PLEO|nr:hypothetical protein P171DRAFT_355481 [Karstenula rhodostoma CBS 690.94]
MSTSIPDNQLGLSQSEVQLLRQHQQIALSQQGSSSSRAASHASSQGRLLLDPSSLQALSAHFDRLMGSIQQRWHYLNQQTQTATTLQSTRAGAAIHNADAEIARFRALLREIDELQVEFDKVRRIGEIVKGFRARVQHLERRF